MDPNWCDNLEQYWLRIEQETRQLLRLVNKDFRSSGMSFDSKFEEYFIQETNDRIASVYKRCLRKMQIEEQFCVRSNRAPAIENPFNKTFAEANRKIETVNNQPTIDSTLSGICVQGDEALQRFRNIDPNNRISSAKAMFGNVSMIATQNDQIRLTAVNGNDQYNDVNRNHLAQKENGMSPSVQIDELANGSTTIDQIASASMGQSNMGLRPVPSSTPFHGLVEQLESNAPMYRAFQKITPFWDQTIQTIQTIDPNDVTSTINTDVSVLTGDVSMLIATIGQSKAINANKIGQNEMTMTSHDVSGPEFSVLTEIDSMTAPESEPIEAELPNDTIFGGPIDIDEEILVEDQAASNARINNSINQATECIDLTCGDVEPPLDGINNQIEKIAVRKEENQRRKSKVGDAKMSNGSSNTRRRTGLRSSTLRTIPESASELALIDQTLNEIENSEQANSTTSQSVPVEGAGSSNADEQSASTSRAKQVAKKKPSVGKKVAENVSKKHKCSFCKYSKSNKWNLKMHMQKHADEFLFHCSICREGFDLEEEKVMHEKSCDTVRYECHLCKIYSAFYKKDLFAHMYKHTGEKPFSCPDCSARFTYKSNLTKHFKRNHNKSK